MMGTLRSKPAFTLIEILISSVVFITVALLATGTLVSTVRMQSTHKQSQNISVQASGILAAIKYDIQASGNNTLRTYVLTDTHSYTAPTTDLLPSATPDDTALIVVVPQRSATGIDPVKTETHVYCAELQNATVANSAGTFTGKRMVRYVIKSSVYDPTKTVAALQSICNPTFIQTVFSPLAPDSTEYLTDQYAEVYNLRFWPVWSSVASTTNYDVNPDGIRTELTIEYSLANAATGIETRISDARYAPTPLVFRTLVGRNKPYSVNN